MKTDVQSLEPTKVKLTVEVSYEELKPSIDHAYKHIAEQINVPGFRPGKAPTRIIEQRVGAPAILEHAINDGLAGFYNQAVNEAELRPLGRPEVEVIKVPELGETDGELHFTAEVEVRPEFDLPDLDTLSVTVDSVEVSDDDVTERLDALRERFGTLVGVDRPAEETDFVVLDLKAEINGEEIDSVSGVSYQVGSGNMLEGLDEALLGLSAGETTTFESALAGGERAGEPGTVTVTATAIKQRELPEADDDFAQLASEFDTLEELLEDLKKQTSEAKVSNQAVQARDALLNELIERVEFPLPQGVIDNEVHDHLERESRLEDDVHRAEVIEETTDGLRRQILLDVLAESLEVKVGQNELLDYLLNTARQYGMDPNEFITQVDQNGQIPSLVAEVARNKSLAVALRRVGVKDSNGQDLDLTQFIGSDADDEAAEATFQAAQQATENVDEEETE